MSWVTFDAAIEPLEWGRNTYTILRLPPEIVAALGNAKRVEGEIGEHPVNLAITRAPVLDDAFLWAGKTFLDAAGIAPGEIVEIRLRPADPDAVDTPPDLLAALRAAERLGDWQALTPGKRRGLIYTIESAKRAGTRAKRIAAIVAALRLPPQRRA